MTLGGLTEDGSERGMGRGSKMERETKTPTVDGTGETGQRFTASPADRQLDKLQSDRRCVCFPVFTGLQCVLTLASAHRCVSVLVFEPDWHHLLLKDFKHVTNWYKWSHVMV